MILVIGSVSAYDNTMTWVYRDSIIDMEKNPVGIKLIEIGGVELFIFSKAIMTIFVTICLVLLVKTKYKMAIFWVFVIKVIFWFYLNYMPPIRTDSMNHFVEDLEDRISEKRKIKEDMPLEEGIRFFKKHYFGVDQ